MKAAIGVSTGKDTVHAAEEALWQAILKLKNSNPNLVITFPTYDHDYRLVQHALARVLPNTPIIGASSVSTFISDGLFKDSAVVLMLLGPEEDIETQIVTGLGEGLSTASVSAVMKALLRIKDKRQPRHSRYYQHRLMLSFIDGLAAFKDDVIEELILETQMDYEIVGAAAAKPITVDQKPTFVFTEDGIANDGVAIAEMLSNVPIGIGIRHGWRPLDDSVHRITDISNDILLEVDGKPAIDFFLEIGSRLGPVDILDWRDLASLLWKLEMGIELPNGEYVLRSPLIPIEENKIKLTTALPKGTTFKIMVSDTEAMLKAVEDSVNDALSALGEVEPAAALLFECLGRKSILGKDFFKELEIINDLLKDVPFLGFHTYGEIAWSELKPSGFHNMSIVTVVFGKRRVL